ECRRASRTMEYCCPMCSGCSKRSCGHAVASKSDCFSPGCARELLGLSNLLLRVPAQRRNHRKSRFGTLRRTEVFASISCLPPVSHRDPMRLPRLIRSEEHTSELQSRENLVCRLLLEKKKHQTTPPTPEQSTAP